MTAVETVLTEGQGDGLTTWAAIGDDVADGAAIVAALLTRVRGGPVRRTLQAEKRCSRTSLADGPERFRMCTCP